MFLVCLCGTISTIFLPETLGAKLPETLADASTFGRDHKFFSYKPNGDGKKRDPDWNQLMESVGFEKNPKKHDIHAELVQDLLSKHYAGLKEAAID